MSVSSPYSIAILSSEKIDKEKWNAVINGSENGIIYAQYEYLQCMTENWMAVVVNDYEAVMPLPYRKKAGILYSYDVPFIQQLGLFGNCDNEILYNVISTVKKRIRYGDLFFNFQNEATAFLNAVTTAANYILPLHSSYTQLYCGYNHQLKKKLKQANRNGLSFSMNDNTAEAIDLFEAIYAKRLPQIKPAGFERLKAAAEYYKNLQQCFVCNSYDDKNNLLAAALFFKDEKRIYNILPATTTEGRKLNAMHFLLDCLIRKFAESRLLLDFEGSDITGIKTFYQSFGAISQPYFHHHYNELFFPLRWLKK